MERLTERHEKSPEYYYYPHCFEENACSETGGISICSECSFENKVRRKLGEYEDLEEQCITETTWGLKMLFEKWKAFFEDIQELYEYRKLEEQGKLQGWRGKMIDEKKLITELKQSGMIADNEYGNAMVNMIDSQPKTGNWIPCTERLPEPEKEIEINIRCISDHVLA